MFTFACKDLGVDCQHVVSGSTKEEVIQKAMEHGSVVHADIMKNMTKEQSEQFATALKAAVYAA